MWSIFKGSRIYHAIRGTGQAPFTCDRVNPLLSLYTDGMTSPTERDSIAAHLASCARCREQSECLRAIQQIILTRPVALPPSDLRQRIAQAIAAETQPVPAFRRTGLALGLAYSIAAVLLSGIVLRVSRFELAQAPHGAAPGRPGPQFAQRPGPIVPRTYSARHSDNGGANRPLEVASKLSMESVLSTDQFYPRAVKRSPMRENSPYHSVSPIVSTEQGEAIHSVRANGWQSKKPKVLDIPAGPRNPQTLVASNQVKSSIEVNSPGSINVIAPPHDLDVPGHSVSVPASAVLPPAVPVVVRLADNSPTVDGSRDLLQSVRHNLSDLHLAAEVPYAAIHSSEVDGSGTVAIVGHNF